MSWLPLLAREVLVSLSDEDVWLSVGQALLFALVCLAFGVWVARRVGLLESNAPAGETLGVGLASGLMVLAAWWAAAASGGRSSFTPVALGFAMAIGLAVYREVRSRTRASGPTLIDDPIVGSVGAAGSSRHGTLILTVLACAAFIAVAGLLYGSTLTKSPRDGEQPLEFNDAAYYSVLGADLARTGTESITTPSGFAEIEGLPQQSWYHWGELWLASAVIDIFGTSPLKARHIVVLPVLLLAAGALTGTLVRRLCRTPSRAAYLFGFVICASLAPIALVPGPFFSAWAVGLIFGISVYGLAAVAAVFSMYGIAVLDSRPTTWALAGFLGSAIAFMVPAHVVVAMLALVGAASVWTVYILRTLVATRGLPSVSTQWRRALIATGVATVASVAVGWLTGHGVGNSATFTSVSPFNASWRDSVAITAMGAGIFIAIPIAWILERRRWSTQAGLYLGTIVLLITGAVAWGARLGDFNMFYLFYGGIAVFATPVAAVAAWSIWMRLRASKHKLLTIAALALALSQLEIGFGLGLARLQDFGTSHKAPAPVGLVKAIGALPLEARLAYACQPNEEIVFWNPRMLGLGAHTGRRVVPMCFQAEFAGVLVGGQMSADIPSPVFHLAPTSKIYPSSNARPSSDDMARFLKEHGIDYIYADAQHPNSLVSDAILIATSGEAQLLRIP